MADSGTTTLACNYTVYMAGTSTKHCYVVTVENGRNALVKALEDEIRENLNFAEELGGKRFFLLKCGDLPMESEETVFQTWLRRNFNEQQMVSARPLTKYFDDGPKGIWNSMIDVVIITPSLIKNLDQPTKRSAPSSLDELATFKRSKVATLAPSFVATKSEFKKIRESPDEKILNDRPGQDPDVVPVSLLYHGFGVFLDIYRGREDVPGVEKVDPAELQLAVDSFATAMCIYYSEESTRTKNSIATINDILCSFKGIQLGLMMAGHVGETRTDGLLIGRHNAAVLVKEDKEGFISNLTDPEVQLASYVAHSFSEASERHETLFRNWRVPCLGITLVGPYIRFYAVVFVGRIHFVSLTPTLSCVSSAGEGDDRIALYAAFTAALVLLSHIKADVADFVKYPPKNPHRNLSLPYVHKIRKFCGSSDAEIDFKLLDWLCKEANRLLFIAETTEKEMILVKFTRRYSTELHSFCANEGRAPNLLGFQELSGGWFVVAMEYKRNAEPLQTAPNLDENRDGWMDVIQHLMQKFHDEGLVHGDLREANMICEDDEVFLVDFDWGGKADEVSYPNAKLNPHLMEGRDVPNRDLRIRKVDDIRVLKKTVENLRDLCSS